MQEAGAIFQPYVAGIFVDQLLTPEEKAQKWKEEHINEIRNAGKKYVK